MQKQPGQMIGIRRDLIAAAVAAALAATTGLAADQTNYIWLRLPKKKKKNNERPYNSLLSRSAVRPRLSLHHHPRVHVSDSFVLRIHSRNWSCAFACSYFSPLFVGTLWPPHPPPHPPSTPPPQRNPPTSPLATHPPPTPKRPPTLLSDPPPHHFPSLLKPPPHPTPGQVHRPLPLHLTRLSTTLLLAAHYTSPPQNPYTAPCASPSWVRSPHRTSPSRPPTSTPSN